MRLFFAIVPTKDALSELTAVQSALRDAVGREGVRWEDPGKLHITLRFLGEVAEERLEAVKEAGREAASACPPFSLEIGALGTFPAGRQPRVLWAGVENEFPEYAQLAEYLDRALAARGFPPEGRSAKPHVTFARVKTPAGSKSISRSLTGNNPKKVDKKIAISVSNVVLLVSELRPGGSAYTILETFPVTALNPS